jgi:leucyl/phenylalanyl-tRNA--protein transferase
MLEAYVTLHRMGRAHSVEAWTAEGELVGGLYGLALGRVFFGESMFSLRTDASKIALATLACQLQRWGFELIDCQQTTQHLTSLGAREIPRTAFIARLAQDCEIPGHTGHWRLEDGLEVDRWQPATNAPGEQERA